MSLNFCASRASTVPADKTTDGLAKGSATDRKFAFPKEHPYAIWAAVKEWFGSGRSDAVKTAQQVENQRREQQQAAAKIAGGLKPGITAGGVSWHCGQR